MSYHVKISTRVRCTNQEGLTESLVPPAYSFSCTFMIVCAPYTSGSLTLHCEINITLETLVLMKQQEAWADLLRGPGKLSGRRYSQLRAAGVAADGAVGRFVDELIDSGFDLRLSLVQG